MLGNVLKSFEFKKQNQINAFWSVRATLIKTTTTIRNRIIFPLLFIKFNMHFAILRIRLKCAD